MKRLEVIVSPSALDVTKEALSSLGIEGMTLTEVKRFSFRSSHVATYRGAEYVVDHAPALRLEVVLDGDRIPHVVAAIERCLELAGLGPAEVAVVPIEGIGRFPAARGPLRPPARIGRPGSTMHLARRTT